VWARLSQYRTGDAAEERSEFHVRHVKCRDATKDEDEAGVESVGTVFELAAECLGGCEGSGQARAGDLGEGGSGVDGGTEAEDFVEAAFGVVGLRGGEEDGETEEDEGGVGVSDAECYVGFGFA